MLCTCQPERNPAQKSWRPSFPELEFSSRIRRPAVSPDSPARRGQFALRVKFRRAHARYVFLLNSFSRHCRLSNNSNFPVIIPSGGPKKSIGPSRSHGCAQHRPVRVCLRATPLRRNRPEVCYSPWAAADLTKLVRGPWLFHSGPPRTVYRPWSLTGSTPMLAAMRPASRCCWPSSVTV